MCSRIVQVLTGLPCMLEVWRSSATPTAREQLDDEEDSDDFTPDVEEPEPEDDFDEDIAEDEDEDEDKDEDGDDSDDVSERDGSNRCASSIVDVDNLVPATLNRKRPKKSAKSKLPRVQRIALHNQVETLKLHKVGGQELRLRDLFGPTDKNIRSILITRDHWDVQKTLPYCDKGGLQGGLWRSFSGSEEATTVRIVIKNRIMSTSMTILTTSIKYSVSSFMYFGDPQYCIDPLPYMIMCKWLNESMDSRSFIFVEFFAISRHPVAHRLGAGPHDLYRLKRVIEL
ncbi:hypothetical protein P153DRAFT_394713 [Dothidotthia symphoricarpi CBS 119687]|uniref:Uncharacterized protein n=1 Tax=Dothidotthia symphoricarpi CBS 119687 TaxID=1392245 RepID=A0A6A6AKG9_9PLEO|nr:uncharacterized protein P153DRAFT_394713 [Dothidotthia symphoricarpi CBS 119687]KAF2131367.1 hypothetical protein P153DRAFT_394713 [Dothidotthia symphoricarpi CBS 119687]